MDKKVIIIISITACCAFFSQSAAHAYKFGEVDVRVRGNASETYDDNITYRKDDTRSDLITALTAGIGAKYEGRLFNFDLVGNVTQQLFADNPNYSNNSQDFTLQALSELSKYDRVNLRDTFSHTYEPRSFEEAFGVTTGRYSYFRNRLYADYTRDIMKNLSAILRYTNAMDMPLRDDLSDSYLNSGGGELDYSLSSATIVSASYDFSLRSFDPGSDAYTHAFAGGLRQYITKQLYFDGRAGADYVISYNKQDYFKPMFGATLTDELDQNTVASVSFMLQSYTNAYSQDVFDYWQVSGDLKKQLLQRLNIALSAFYGRGKYLSLDIKDDLFGCNAGLVYDFTEHIRGSITYRYSNAASTSRAREYSKNTVYVGLTAEF